MGDELLAFRRSMEAMPQSWRSTMHTRCVICRRRRSTGARTRDRPAHLAGIGVGGMVAQVAALDYPHAFSALTLAGTRPVAPGRVDEDLPDHDAATMERLFSRPMPDWSDRAAVAEFATADAEILGNDPVAARTTAERIWDRTPGTEPAAQMDSLSETTGSVAALVAGSLQTHSEARSCCTSTDTMSVL